MKEDEEDEIVGFSLRISPEVARRRKRAYDAARSRCDNNRGKEFKGAPRASMLGWASCRTLAAESEGARSSRWFRPR